MPAFTHFAVALTVVSDKEMLVCQLKGTVASLRATGFRQDTVCLVHDSGIYKTHRAELQQSCTHLLPLAALPDYDAGPSHANTSEMISWARSNGKVPPMADAVLQRREDGRATAVKFAAWALTQYDMVLHTDIDVHFLQSPLPALQFAERHGILFHAASSERAKRGYEGLNTHMMLLKPNRHMLALLAANAAEGHFVPYTRTEQDVLESTFPRTVALGNLRLRGEPSSTVAAAHQESPSSPDPASAVGFEGSDFYGRPPNVTMPAHLHYFHHGCSARYCCGKIQPAWVVPRRACKHSVHRHHNHASWGTAGGVRGGPAAHSGSSVARVAARVHAFERTGGSLGELRYDIEWLGGSSSSVPTTHLLSDLCGSVLELIERCHAYMWPEVRPSTAGAKSDKVPASQHLRSTHSSHQRS